MNIISGYYENQTVNSICLVHKTHKQVQKFLQDISQEIKKWDLNRFLHGSVEDKTVGFSMSVIVHDATVRRATS